MNYVVMSTEAFGSVFWRLFRGPARKVLSNILAVNDLLVQVFLVICGENVPTILRIPNPSIPREILVLVKIS